MTAGGLPRGFAKDAKPDQIDQKSLQTLGLEPQHITQTVRQAPFLPLRHSGA